MNPVVSGERIFQVVWNLKTEGYADSTLEGFTKRLKFLAQYVDLDRVDAAKRFISAQRGWGNAYEENMVNAYNHYVDAFDLSWEKPIYKRSERLHQPELGRIRFYDLRHYFATHLYRRTKDISFVKRQLGHKRIENTLIYMHLVDFASEEFVCRVAENVKEVTALVESGFEYVTEIDGKKVFRKPK